MDRVSENFDSERSGFTTFPPDRKGEMCIRNSENEKSRSDTGKKCVCAWISECKGVEVTII